MTFGFVTCVQLGLSCMEEIYRLGGQLSLVITLPDDIARSKSGRIYVDDFCARRGIEVVKVRHLNDRESIEAIRSRRIDWLFIIGWSQIAGPEVLAAPVRGCLGMHPSLLPQGRGRAAIPWAILKGLDRTGVTMFQLNAGVDTGPVLGQEALPLDPQETATSLYRRVTDAHQTLMARVWPALVADTIELRQQDESQASTWPGRTPADGVIRPEMDCVQVDRLVRAVTRPYPGAFIDNGPVRYTIWRARLHRGSRAPDLFAVDPNGHLWFDVSDGCAEALDWTAGPAVPRP
jgi:methionyl-tRNA formyltransferase